MAHPGSGFRGDAFLGDLTPSPLTTQSIILVLFYPPLVLFYDIYFRPINPINFIMAPLAPICTNFEGERAPKNYYFLDKIFQKVPKNCIFDLFCFKFACGAKKLSK